MVENTVNILKCLMNKIEKRIDIHFEKSYKFERGNSLKNRPLFTIKEINLHRKNSGKIPSLAIVKILESTQQQI